MVYQPPRLSGFRHLLSLRGHVHRKPSLDVEKRYDTESLDASV